MDNFLPFSSSSNANSFQETSMDLYNNNSNFSMIPTYNHQLAQPDHPLLTPYSYDVACSAAMIPQPLHSSEAFPHMQTRSEFGSVVRNRGSGQERGGFPDPHMTKMARINRMNAMRRPKNNSNPISWLNDLVDSRRQQISLTMKTNSEIAPREEIYRFSAFDNKKLRVLLVKHLKNSDVGTLGRIVLPKREAEGNLPELTEKEGMILEMRDADSTQSWSFKYKYWCNNKSRMYVLENTGDFVKKNRVKMGDYLTIYEDESKNLYFSISKYAVKNEGRRGDPIMEVNDRNLYEGITFDFMPNDEDEDSIAMLIGNLNDHYPNPNDLMGLPMELDQHHHQATTSLPPVDHVTDPTHVVGSSNDQVSFDDFDW